MNYGDTAADLRKSNSSLESTTAAINGIAFDKVWSGSAHDSFISKLQVQTRNLELVKGNIDTFNSALDELNNYKAKKEKMDSLKAELASIPDNETNKSTRAAISSEIGELNAELIRLKESIQAKINQIVGNDISKDTTAKDTTVVDDKGFEYVVDIESLKQRLKGLGLSPNLYNAYNYTDANGNNVAGINYVLGVLDNIKAKYTGREAAVNCTLALIKLAADAGFKMPYVHKGTTGVEPYVPTNEVVTGVDCNPFVSWAVDKGVSNGFQWRPVGEFRGVGKEVSYNQLQPGDVLSGEGHVMFVVANDPANNKLTVAHASGTQIGILVQDKQYSQLAGEYSGRDMTDVYNGTSNTNRAIFNNYVDWNSYQRKK